MRRNLALLPLLLILLLLAGCAGRDKFAGIPPDELYRQAVEAVDDSDWELAETILNRIRDDFPFSRFAVEAELLMADAAYRQDKFEEAAAAYRSFEELHPTHPRVDYAVYRRGNAYLELSRPADRDQTSTRDAAQAFQKLLFAHPQSEHAEEVRGKLTEMRDRLADHELHVARYYVRKKKYEAALGRLEYLVQTYPESSRKDEALALAQDVKARARRAGEPED